MHHINDKIDMMMILTDSIELRGCSMSFVMMFDSLNLDQTFIRHHPFFFFFFFMPQQRDNLNELSPSHH
jgi:hypothetical protein